VQLASVPQQIRTQKRVYQLFDVVCNIAKLATLAVIAFAQGAMLFDPMQPQMRLAKQRAVNSATR
jgi:hypothetical protein